MFFFYLFIFYFFIFLLTPQLQRGMRTESSTNGTVLPNRLLSFPTNLINASDTRRGIARAFGLWSDVSPFSFREVPADEEADIKIGGCLLCLHAAVSNRCCLAPGSRVLLCCCFSLNCRVPRLGYKAYIQHDS